MNRFFIFIFHCFFFCSFIYAQPEIQMPKVPVMRQLFHINIDEAQQKIIKINNPDDTVFTATPDSNKNLEITFILKLHINNLQASIELDTSLSENDKFISLRGVETLLKDFIYNYENKKIEGDLLGNLILSFEESIFIEKQHQSIIPIIDKMPYEIGSIILHNPLFQLNSDFKIASDRLILKLCKRQPDNILKILNVYPNVYFRDSVIKVIAYKNQEQLYNYASSSSEFGDSLRNSSEPLVSTISKLALKNSGRMFFPFLDLLYRGKLSYDTIQSAISDEHVYFKLLVKTQILYAERMQKGDTPIVYKAVEEKLRSKAIEIYIDEINALHDEKLDEVRFQSIDSLSPAELYYLCVLGEEEIYTSSYLGVYKRIFERMKVPKADSLLSLVHFDFYKKFIKMAASYNQLDDFLKRMDSASSDRIMRSFVTDLERKSTLEDAVDVADSYSSITNKKLRKLILNQIKQNALKDTSMSVRASVIYKILYTILLSMDSSKKVNLTNELGINPVFEMPTRLLRDSSGKIIIQQFFYGDEDGKHIFEAFLERFKKPNWKTIETKEWVEIKSITGKSVVIYANKPLDTDKDLDEAAQNNLINYLDSMHLSPTIVIHRGHSYYLKYTINQLPSSAKLILLGSCGGYQSLDKVLQICPDAQIISSKQVGTGAINQVMISLISEQLRQGKDLNWPTIWKTLTEIFDDTKSKDKFYDYIPPHKNLGAIFIIAFNRAMQFHN